MKRITTLVALALALATTNATAKTVLQRFQAKAKGSPLLLVKKNRLIVRSADGKLKTILANGVDVAAYDHRLGLVSYLKGHRLYVVDLRARHAGSRVIATGIRSGTGNGPADELIISRKKYGVSGGEVSMHATTFTLTWKRQIKGELSWGEQTRAVTISGANWLRRNRHRRYSRARNKRVKPRKSRVAAAASSGWCSDKSECGRAAALPRSRYWLAKTSYSCGDGCHSQCARGKCPSLGGDFIAWLGGSTTVDL